MIDFNVLSIDSRIDRYLPTKEELAFYPTPGPHEKEIKARRHRDQQNPSYALVQRDDDPTKFVMVPQHHPMNLYAPETPGAHYSQVAFDGEALYPKVDESGKLIGASLALFENRSMRFINSVLSLGVGEFPMEVRQSLAQAVLDLAAVSVQNMLDAKGDAARLYVRRAGERRGRFGVTPKPGDRVHLTVNMWRWPFYLPPEVYDTGATVATFWDAQRLTQLHGKVAGNYSIGHLGKRAFELGAHEIMFWGPFTTNKDGSRTYVNYQDGPKTWQNMRTNGSLVDGAGEDAIYEHRNGDLILIPANGTNILAGTTRRYIGSNLAPKLGIKVQERDVSINEIDKGDIVGLALLGNAVMVAPVTKIVIADTQGEKVDEINLNLTPGVQAIQNRYRRELHGEVETSGNLLTPIDVAGGIAARAILDEVFKEWI